MTLQKFKHYLYRGMGAAIIELQKNPKVEYKKVVLYACTHHTKYHGQDEPDRAEYLYKALKVFKDDNYFIEGLSKALGKTQEMFLTIQLVNILMHLSNDGHKERIINELQKRLDRYFIELPKEDWSDWHDGRESAEELMINLYQLIGMESFFTTVESIGRGMTNYSHDTDLFFYDELIEKVLENLQLTKAALLIQKYNIASKNIIKVLKKYDEDNERFINNRHNRVDSLERFENMTVEEFLNYGEKRRYFIPLPHIRSFLKSQSINHEVLKELALSYSTSHFERKNVIMRIFAFVDFPFGVAELLQYLDNENDVVIRGTILTALSRFNDQRIRQIVLKNMEALKNILESLTLFRKSVIQDDIPFLTRLLRNHRDKNHDYDEVTESTDFFDFHGLMQEYLWLMEVNPSIDFGNIYKLLLDRHLCAACRSHLLEILCANEHALNYLGFIKTCVEDSHEDTRRIAQEFLDQYYRRLM